MSAVKSLPPPRRTGRIRDRAVEGWTGGADGELLRADGCCRGRATADGRVLRRDWKGRRSGGGSGGLAADLGDGGRAHRGEDERARAGGGGGGLRERRRGAHVAGAG